MVKNKRKKELLNKFAEKKRTTPPWSASMKCEIGFDSSLHLIITFCLMSPSLVDALTFVVMEDLSVVTWLLVNL